MKIQICILILFVILHSILLYLYIECVQKGALWNNQYCIHDNYDRPGTRNILPIPALQSLTERADNQNFA